MDNISSNKEKRENPFSSLLRLAEFPLSVAAIAGICLKLFKMPGGSLLLLLALSTLSVFYLFAAISFTGDEKTTNTDKIIFRLNGIGSSAGVIGILFLLQHWPGSNMMILVSCGALSATVIYMIKEKGGNVFDSKMIFRTIAIVFLEILLFIVS